MADIVVSLAEEADAAEEITRKLATELEIDLFTRFLVQVLDTNPDTRLDPAQALTAWEELSQAMTAKLDGASAR